MMPIQSPRILETVILFTGLVTYVLFSASPLNIYIILGACLLFLPWTILDRFPLMLKLLLVPLSVLVATFAIIIGTIQNPTVIGGFDSAADPEHNVTVMARNLSFFIIYPITVASAKLSAVALQKARTSEKSTSTSKQQSTDPTSTKNEGSTQVKLNSRANNTNIYERNEYNTKVYENDEK